jgi:hypothetical protein
LGEFLAHGWVDDGGRNHGSKPSIFNVFGGDDGRGKHAPEDVFGERLVSDDGPYVEGI